MLDNIPIYCTCCKIRKTEYINDTDKNFTSVSFCKDCSKHHDKIHDEGINFGTKLGLLVGGMLFGLLGFFIMS